MQVIFAVIVAQKSAFLETAGEIVKNSKFLVVNPLVKKIHQV